MKKLTVSAIVSAPLTEVWECWTAPEHIIKWNFASDDWECPWAENDLRTGGRFVSRMSAKVGPEGFDLKGSYTIVELLSTIAYVLEDGREVKITFVEDEGRVTVTETFEMEDKNSEDKQRAGWQAILNNFKQYTEIFTMKQTHPIVPYLWFDTEAKAAAEFYVSIFPNSKLISSNTLSDTPSGTVEIVTFELNSQRFDAISAGPYFTFTSAVSFFTTFDNEDEITEVWNTLVEGGEVLMPFAEYSWAAKYGWCKDKYGLSWQLSLSEENKEKQKITPFLMFTGENAGKAEEAVAFYTGLFMDSSTDLITKYVPGEGDVEGYVKQARFTLAGGAFIAMDSSAPHGFTFSEATSFMVKCDTQEELDEIWSKLSAVPEAEQCGWCKDKYGLSWQIVPSIMDTMMSSGDKEAMGRVTQVFLKMKKFDIKKLKEAYNQTN